MAVQITIIGLGEIGTSLGLALKYQKETILRVGSDIHKYAEQNALSADAIDRIEHNLFNAIQDADIVFLTIPTDEVEAVMKLIGNDLKEDCVVFETGFAKAAAKRWASQYLKTPSNFAGLYAAINPAWLNETSNEFHSAHEDLFKNGTLFISSTADTAPSVVKLASDLASLIGSFSAFCDPEELDGFIASIFNMPYLMGNVILNTAKRQNSWREVRKMGGKTFSEMTQSAAMQPDREQYGKFLLENRENTLHMIHEFMFTLKEFRDAIQENDEAALKTLLKNCGEDREKWLQEYQSGEWRNERETNMHSPTTGEFFGQLFLGGLARKKKK